jgi:long-chain acyl-CoA synthetase
MTSLILEAVRRHAAARPEAVALQGLEHSVKYGELPRLVDDFARQLRERRVTVLGLVLDNTPAAVVVDLAANQVGICVSSLPPFFSNTQLWHALRDCGANGLLTDQPPRLEAVYRSHGVEPQAPTPVTVCGTTLYWYPPPPDARDPRALEGMAKVTYTSGTTGNPKGTLLRQTAMDLVVTSLIERLETRPSDRYLSVLPLSMLLETVAGAYGTLAAGATYVVWGMARVGLAGSSGLNPSMLASALSESQATMAITTPVVLRMLTLAREAGTAPATPALRFFGVGGASVSRALVERAHKVGIPAYEGYGLTETASVVTVNAPSASRPGSVGRPLAHVRVRIAPDGEVFLAGSLYEGYLGHPSERPQDGFYSTGDIGRLDEDGFLHLTGRKKNIFITSFGRNVSPEWVESEISQHKAIGQVVLFGDARPWNVAVIFPAPGATDAEVDQAVAATNPTLPDYARVARWVRADAPFTPANGQLTATGKPLRPAIFSAYSARIEALYAQDAAARAD